METKQVYILLLAILPLGMSAQSLTFGKVRTGVSDTLAPKTHVSLVLEFDSLTSAQLYSGLRAWFIENFFQTEMVYRNGFNAASGWPEPMPERKVPFKVDTPNERLFAELVRCNNCSAVSGRRGKLLSMLYALDIRFREGRVKVTLYDFWDMTDKVYLREYTTRHGEIIIQPEHLIRKSIEAEGKRLELSIKRFLVTGSVDEKDRSTPKFDQW